MNTLKDKEFDAIIVGTGPGGGSVANELSKRGWKTLILEKGRGDPIKGTATQLISMGLIPGKSLHFTQQMLSLIHGITVGGSSVFYYACAFDPPYELFESYGIDLRPEVDKAKKELPIAPLSDELGGHLTERGGVRKRFSEIEHKRLMSGYEKTRKILSNAGARNVYKTWYLATHPGGTVKINDVVDSNLKTEIDNLFVCDCSVIPEAWGQPPSLTLIALGKRLGNHLLGHSNPVS